MNNSNLTLYYEDSEDVIFSTENFFSNIAYEMPSIQSGWIVFEEEISQSSIEETEYLLSIPGMADSILEGGSTPIDECLDDPGF